jgi:hypothetical protein
MKKIIISLAVILIVVPIVFAQGRSPGFTEVVDNLNLSKKTSLAVKTYWLELKGQEVSWSGNVVNVKGGRGKAEIYVANKQRSSYKGYNIILETYDVEGAAKLDIGRSIKFKGLVNDYKGKQGHPVVIYLNQVELK